VRGIVEDVDWVVGVVYAGFLAGTGALAVIDARTKLLPDRIVFPLYALAAVGLPLASALGRDWTRLWVALVMGALLYGLFWVLWFFGGLGYGDVNLIGLVGLYLGWLGATVADAGVLLGTLAASLYYVGKLLLRKATRKTELAYGPYLIAGAWAALALHAAGIV
jgi:leader peptidase (prepilin peptidase)/N-methyltransferase